jgi:hypothetical protein
VVLSTAGATKTDVKLSDRRFGVRGGVAKSQCRTSRSELFWSVVAIVTILVILVLGPDRDIQSRYMSC